MDIRFFIDKFTPNEVAMNIVNAKSVVELDDHADNLIGVNINYKDNKLYKSAYGTFKYETETDKETHGSERKQRSAYLALMRKAICYWVMYEDSDYKWIFLAVRTLYRETFPTPGKIYR